MRNLNYKIILVSLLAVMLTFQSCQIDEDLNDNPAQPSEVPLRNILPTLCVSLAYSTSGEAFRWSGIFSRHLEGINAQHEAYWRYVVTELDADDVWTPLYTNALNNASILIDQAREENAPVYAGIAQVIMAYSYNILTDLHGDIPVSQALQAANGVIKPQYDNQEVIYNVLLPELLDNAIADLSASGDPGKTPGADDLFFGGDVQKWIDAANSLKVRLAIQQSKVTPSAYDDALNLLPSAISNADGDFQFQFNSARNEVHPNSAFIQSGRAGNIKMDSVFIAQFETSDTRQPFLINDDFELGTTVGNFTKPTGIGIIMSYIELKMIEAEAHLMGSGADETSAKSALDEGVSASFQKITGTPTPTDYQTALDDAWNNATTLEDKLVVVMEEKYIACYGMGITAWNDWRRTNLPAFIVPPTTAASEFTPRSLPYPQNERLLNGENLSEVTNEPTNLLRRNWWDQ